MMSRHQDQVITQRGREELSDVTASGQAHFDLSAAEVFSIPCPADLALGQPQFFHRPTADPHQGDGSGRECALDADAQAGFEM